MKTKELEERIINRIVPKLEEKLEKRLVKRLSLVTREEYPSESQFKNKFVREVKMAQTRIKKGKGRKFKDKKEFKKFLDSLR